MGRVTQDALDWKGIQGAVTMPHRLRDYSQIPPKPNRRRERLYAGTLLGGKSSGLTAGGAETYHLKERIKIRLYRKSPSCSKT